MSNLFAKYETDPKKELKGIEVKVDDVTFRIRRAGGSNRAWRAELSKAAAPYRAEIDGAVDDAEKLDLLDVIEREAFVRAVLIGWENLEDRDGDDLDFSVEAALDLLESCPTVWLELKAAAIDDKRFKPDEDGKRMGE